jgi:hypothetical protein
MGGLCALPLPFIHCRDESFALTHGMPVPFVWRLVFFRYNLVTILMHKVHTLTDN